MRCRCCSVLSAALLLMAACSGDAPPGVPGYEVTDVLRAAEYCNVTVESDLRQPPTPEELHEAALSLAEQVGGARVYRVIFFSPGMTPGEGGAYATVEVTDGEVSHYQATGMEWR